MFRSSRAGGVHRLGADTSSMRSGWGRWKQDGLRAESAGLAEAQPEHLVLLSKTEVEQHELTHLPFRSWYQHCVRAKGKDSRHHESNKACVANVVPCEGTSHGYAERARDFNTAKRPRTEHHRRQTQSQHARRNRNRLRRKFRLRQQLRRKHRARQSNDLRTDSCNQGLH